MSGGSSVVRARSARLLACAAGLLVLGAPLTGCGFHPPGGLTLKPSESTLPKCSTTDPVPVEDLGKNPRATCDLVGTPIVSPDGKTIRVPEVLGQTASGSLPDQAVHGVSNLGVYGVVASLTQADPVRTTWWGTKDGIALQIRYNGRDNGNGDSSQ